MTQYRALPVDDRARYSSCGLFSCVRSGDPFRRNLSRLPDDLVKLEILLQFQIAHLSGSEELPFVRFLFELVQDEKSLLGVATVEKGAHNVDASPRNVRSTNYLG